MDRDAGWNVVEGSGKYEEEKREEEETQCQATQRQEKRKEGSEGRKGRKEGGRGGHAPVSQAGSDVPVQRVVSDVGLSPVEETDMDRSHRPIEVIGD